MSARIDYPLLKEHDPNGTRLRTLLVLLDTGDSLLNTTTIVPVDGADADIVGGEFSVEVVSIGLIAALATGDLWGCNIKLHDGVDLIGTTALIRMRPYLASQPGEPAYDQTYRVPVRHT